MSVSGLDACCLDAAVDMLPGAVRAECAGCGQQEGLEALWQAPLRRYMALRQG